MLSASGLVMRAREKGSGCCRSPPYTRGERKIVHRLMSDTCSSSVRLQRRRGEMLDPSMPNQPNGN